MAALRGLVQTNTSLREHAGLGVPLVVGSVATKQKAQPVKAGLFCDFGVADGARTHDNRNHNPDSLVFVCVE